MIQITKFHNTAKCKKTSRNVIPGIPNRINRHRDAYRVLEFLKLCSHFRSHRQERSRKNLIQLDSYDFITNVVRLETDTEKVKQGFCNNELPLRKVD